MLCVRMAGLAVRFGLRSLFTLGLALFTAAIKHRLAFVQHKTVLTQQMLRKIFNHIAMQVRKRAAVQAPDVHMTFLTGVELIQRGLAHTLGDIAA